MATSDKTQFYSSIFKGYYVMLIMGEFIVYNRDMQKVNDIAIIDTILTEYETSQHQDKLNSILERANDINKQIYSLSCDYLSNALMDYTTGKSSIYTVEYELLNLKKQILICIDGINKNFDNVQGEDY